LEKALKSLKTRKWRYNKKRRQTLQEDEEFPPNRRQRIDNPKEDTDPEEDTDQEEDTVRFENIQEEAEDEEEIQHTEEPENANEMESIQDGVEDNNVEDTDKTADEIDDLMFLSDDQIPEMAQQDEDLLEEEENLENGKKI